MSIPKSSLRVETDPAVREIARGLVEHLSPQSRVGSLCIAELVRRFERADGQAKGWYELWAHHYRLYIDLYRVGTLAGIRVDSQLPGLGYYLLQAYVWCILDSVARVLDVSSPGLHESILAWPVYFTAETGALEAELDKVVSSVLKRDTLMTSPILLPDVIAEMLQEFVPAQIRHLTGEYFTPAWLIEHCLNKLTVDVPEHPVVMDPACGAGGFLAHYLARFGMRERLHTLVGFDISPLAVTAAQVGIQWVAAAHGLNSSVSIHLADCMCDQANELTGRVPERAATAVVERVLERYRRDKAAPLDRIEATCLVGNPPWILWDGVLPEYRDLLRPEWKGTPLYVHAGWRAKVSAGKTDVSALCVWRAVDRYALSGSQLVFVLPQATFKSKESSKGFRMFTTAQGKTFPLREVDYFDNGGAFKDASNRPAVALFQVGARAMYPIPATEWKAHPVSSTILCPTFCESRPIVREDITSPLVFCSGKGEVLLEQVSSSPYRARGGVNTGGANGVFWLRVLSREEGSVMVSNWGDTGKARYPVRTGFIEEELVYPLARGRDVRKWQCRPGQHILLCYDEACPKHAMPEEVLISRYPRTYEYVKAFQDILERRKEYKRWGQKGPFYEVYRIGEYTFAPYKVMWRHTFSGELGACVAEKHNAKVIIPDQKVVMVPLYDSDEAHFVCAFLNSSVVNNMLRKCLGLDASPYVLDYVPVPRYDAGDPVHRRLAALSREAHVEAQESSTKAVEEVIDRLVAGLPGVKYSRPAAQDLSTEQDLVQ